MRDHPNFLVRAIGRLLRLIVTIVGMIALGAAAVWFADEFFDTHVMDEARALWDKARSFGWKKTAGALFAALVGLYLFQEAVFGPTYHPHDRYPPHGHRNRYRGQRHYDGDADDRRPGDGI